MDAKLKSAMEGLKSAIAAVESCMSQESSISEPEETNEESGEEVAAEVMPEKDMGASNDKKKLVMAMMKKKGY